VFKIDISSLSGRNIFSDDNPALKCWATFIKSPPSLRYGATLIDRARRSSKSGGGLRDAFSFLDKIARVVLSTRIRGCRGDFTDIGETERYSGGATVIAGSATSHAQFAASDYIWLVALIG
jgi:hypothetical protein